MSRHILSSVDLYLFAASVEAQTERRIMEKYGIARPSTINGEEMIALGEITNAVANNAFDEMVKNSQNEQAEDEGYIAWNREVMH